MNRALFSLSVNRDVSGAVFCAAFVELFDILKLLGWIRLIKPLKYKTLAYISVDNIRLFK